MKKLFTILFISLFIFSCDDHNPVSPGFEVPDGYVFLWGEFYNIEGTYELDNDDDSYLHYINVDCQQLVGKSIPSEIGQLVNLSRIDLDGCGLIGEIPDEIGSLTNLYQLKLFDNQLSGEIPQEVCDLIENNNLDINLVLNGNQLINNCP